MMQAPENAPDYQTSGIMQVYVYRDGRQLGPYTLDEIRGHLNDGFLLPNDLAWHESVPDWLPLSQLPGVVTQAVRVPPPRPMLPSLTQPDAKSGYSTVTSPDASRNPVAKRGTITAKGWLALAIVGGIIFTISHLGNLVSGDGERSSPATQPRISKDNWWQKANPVRGYPQGTRYINAGKSAFFRAVGKPDHSSTIGSELYLSWDCSDGMIQIDCSSDLYEASGLILGNINDF
jgi:GYF domain 2